MSDEQESSAPISGAIQKDVERLLREPAPDKGGRIDVAGTRDGVELEVQQKVGKDWSLGAWTAWAKEKGWAFAGKVSGSWGR